MSKDPVITLKRKFDKKNGVRWYVIVRGEIYGPARLVTTTAFLEHAVALAEMHLRLWGYNEIEVTKALANMYRNLRRRYGAWVMEAVKTEAQREATKQLEPYPD